MFVDTHCHLSFPEFDQDRDAVIARLAEAQVSILIDPGIDLPTSRKSIELASNFDGIYANVGLHPHEAHGNLNKNVYEELTALAKSKKVVAIGEIGLDYHYPDYDQKAQHETFREMLRIAQSLDFPVVIHCRDAWKDMLHILSEESHSAMRGVMHCFSGDTAIADECVRKGFKLSISGSITYKRSLLPEVIRNISLDDILTETDAPYLAPVPWRGKRNEPAWVRIVTETIANIKEITLEEAAEHIRRNTFDVFRLPPS